MTVPSKCALPIGMCRGIKYSPEARESSILMNIAQMFAEKMHTWILRVCSDAQVPDKILHTSMVWATPTQQ